MKKELKGRESWNGRGRNGNGMEGGDKGEGGGGEELCV